MKSMLRGRVRSSAIVAAAIVMSFFAGRASRAQSSTRVFELRTYTTPEGKLDPLLARFRGHTMALFEKHNMVNMGYWVPQDSPRSHNTLIYMLAHHSREDATRNWAAFNADPEWQRVRTQSEAAGALVTHVDSVFLNPTDFSPLQ
jgi:hypothetical protein